MFRIMGGTCSSQRQRALWREEERSNAARLARSRRSGSNSDLAKPACRRSLRHSVVSAIPDGSIASLYPVDDNYINVDTNRRSPKSLAALCTDAVCRSLPYLDGELPPCLPQDIVDDIVHSLVKHSALNATTLRALKNCELGALCLVGCRGVTDEWLEALSSRSLSPPSSPGVSSKVAPDMDCFESMDLDDQKKSQECFYGTVDAEKPKFQDTTSTSSCSTSSFVSAASNLAPDTDQYMDAAETTSCAAMTVAPMEDITMVEERTCSSPTPFSSNTCNLSLLDLRGSQRLTDKGLMQLTDLNRLEVAKLDNCHAIVGRGLLALSLSHRLHTLSLANCRRLTDEAVINISHLNSLEALSLDGCRCLTDRSLAAISELYNLRKLDLSQCDLITDSGLEHLDTIEALEELSLGWCRSITNEGLNALTTQPGRALMLRILRLARCLITDDGVEYLGRLSALEELDLNGCSNIGSTALGRTLERLNNLTILDVSYCPGILRTSWQGKIKALKTLELCYSGVKDAHLAKLVDLPALQEINLDSCPVGDWAIAHLADNDVVPNLTSLDLADTDLTDLGMVHLPKFKNLVRLSLFYCNITNGGLRYIADLTNLEVLNLDSREISDGGLCHLRNLQKLRCLDVFSGRITDSGCAHISRIKSLETLELCGGGVGDLGCTMLSTLDNLTSLNLSQNERITNQGARALSALSNLKALNLSNTRVNASALRHLGGLVKLQSLALYGCRGIEDGNGLAMLQDGLPSLKCLRLNTSAKEDGTFVAGEDDDEEDSGDFEVLREDDGGLEALHLATRFAGHVSSIRGGIDATNFAAGAADNDGASVDSSENSYMEEQIDDPDDESLYSDHD